MRTTVAVLDHRLVRVEVERDDEGAGAVGRRKRLRLPAARRQPQRGVLELWLRRGELYSELAKHLAVRVERLARVAPSFVRERRPGHGLRLTARDR